MSTKWKAGGYGGRIEPVECIKETEKQVTIRFLSGGFACAEKFYERRVSKVSTYECYFDSWDEAKAHLQKKAESKLHIARAELQRAQDELGNVKGLKKPEDA